jgi:hypothetical protein
VSIESPLLIGLSAVMVAMEGEAAKVLVTRRPSGERALPFGRFDPGAHRTFERSLRDWVRAQTGLDIGYAEQLYTFGDKDRERPEATLAGAPADAHVISIGYLALTPAPDAIGASFDAEWADWYRFFPWEDLRGGRPDLVRADLVPRLMDWAGKDETRRERVRMSFGLDGARWSEEGVLERYELLYETGLVDEFSRDRGMGPQGALPGEAMASDHRRILATGMSRLRSKIKYRPVVFDLLPERFTLSDLQHAMEALLGFHLHTQNFRRALEKTDLVRGTGEMDAGTGGRPAELFGVRREHARSLGAPGLPAPRRRGDWD